MPDVRNVGTRGARTRSRQSLTNTAQELQSTLMEHKGRYHNVKSRTGLELFLLYYQLTKHFRSIAHFSLNSSLSRRFSSSSADILFWPTAWLAPAFCRLFITVMNMIAPAMNSLPYFVITSGGWHPVSKRCLTPWGMITLLMVLLYSTLVQSVFMVPQCSFIMLLHSIKFK